MAAISATGSLGGAQLMIGCVKQPFIEKKSQKLRYPELYSNCEFFPRVHERLRAQVPVFYLYWLSSGYTQHMVYTKNV